MAPGSPGVTSESRGAAVISPAVEPTRATLDDPLAEALRVIRLADDAGLQVRLMGGLSFHARCPDWTAQIGRDGRDIDLVTRTKDRKPFMALMERQGYVADRQYNALYGHKQLYFVDPARARPVDILIDRLEMCHRIELADRLAVDMPTVPLAEMLLSKLQVVKVNRKDILDALALLSEYPLGPTDAGTINVGRIGDLTARDWGWWRTVTGNLDKLRIFVAADVHPGDLNFGRPARFDVLSQIAALRSSIEGVPKSARWKLRARVGERVRWFEEPEEVGHGR
jgi:hypothetical protein